MLRKSGGTDIQVNKQLGLGGDRMRDGHQEDTSPGRPGGGGAVGSQAPSGDVIRHLRAAACSFLREHDFSVCRGFFSCFFCNGDDLGGCPCSLDDTGWLGASLCGALQMAVETTWGVDF